MRKKKRVKGSCFRIYTGWENILKISGSAQCFGPEIGWHGCLDKKCSNNIIDCVKRAFSFAILWGGVWTGEPKDNAVFEEKVSICKIIKFFTIITLYKMNRKKEMSSYITLKVGKNSMCIRFIS